jgi:CHAT domain-containing protein
LERISTGIYESTQRLLLLGDLDRLTTRLAGRLLADGDTVGALLVTERGRSRVASAAPTRAALEGVGARPGHLTIAYAFVGDTLVAWRSSANGLVAHRRPASRDSILASIAEINGRLALGVADGRTDSLLVRLHEWLAAELLPPASDSAVLTIVADGELADAPFAALRDGATGRHLIQDVELRFAPSVLVERQRRREGSAAVVTAIGVSAGDPQRGLMPLAGAERESGEVASLYQMGRAIRAAEANAGRVAEALGSSRIVHFAAHAVADPVRPLESFVLLGGGGRLAAREVAAMRLEGLELVVMAACETQRAAEGGAGTMAGLTWAFLRAGARGVIGSSWRVDDEATRRLMLAMHRRHAAGLGAAAALRAAQLEMLGDGDARWRSPASWAGFRYATATNN